jgi:hypothetical protein
MPQPTTAAIFRQFAGNKVKVQSHIFTWFGDPLQIDAKSIALKDGILTFAAPDGYDPAQSYFLAHISAAVDGFFEGSIDGEGIATLEGVEGAIAKEVYLITRGKKRLEKQVPAPSLIPLIEFTKPQFSIYPEYWRSELAQFFQDQRKAVEELMAAVKGVRAYEESYNKLAGLMKGNPGYDDVIALLRLRDCGENFTESVKVIAARLSTTPASLIKKIDTLTDDDRDDLSKSVTNETALLILLAARTEIPLESLVSAIDVLGQPLQSEIGAIEQEEAQHERQIFLANCNLCDLAIERSDGLTSQAFALSLQSREAVAHHVNYLLETIFKVDSATEPKPEDAPKFRKSRRPSKTSQKAIEGGSTSNPPPTPTPPPSPPKTS